MYVLGLDHDIVRQGIEIKYEFPESKGAAEYLEKIVQIPFHLPGLEVDRISRFVGKDYADVIDICPTAPEVFAKGMEPNPRQVKRVLNVYRTLWELAEVREGNWEMDPVEPELLAKMVVLQSRFSAQQPRQQFPVGGIHTTGDLDAGGLGLGEQLAGIVPAEETLLDIGLKKRRHVLVEASGTDGPVVDLQQGHQKHGG